MKSIFLVANSARVKKRGLSRKGPIKEVFFHFHLERGFPLFFLEMGREASGAEEAARPEGWRWRGGWLEHICQQGQEWGRRAMNGDDGSCPPPAFAQAQLCAQPSARAVMLHPPEDPGPRGSLLGSADEDTASERWIHLPEATQLKSTGSGIQPCVSVAREVTLPPPRVLRPQGSVHDGHPVRWGLPGVGKPRGLEIVGCKQTRGSFRRGTLQRQAGEPEGGRKRQVRRQRDALSSMVLPPPPGPGPTDILPCPWPPQSPGKGGATHVEQYRAT